MNPHPVWRPSAEGRARVLRVPFVRPRQALANPEALEYFRGWAELQNSVRHGSPERTPIWIETAALTKVVRGPY